MKDRCRDAAFPFQCLDGSVPFLLNPQFRRGEFILGDLSQKSISFDFPLIQGPGSRSVNHLPNLNCVQKDKIVIISPWDRQFDAELTILIVGSKVLLIKLSFPLPEALIQSLTCLNKWRILSSLHSFQHLMTTGTMLILYSVGQGGGDGGMLNELVLVEFLNFPLYPWLSTLVCPPSE